MVIEAEKEEVAMVREKSVVRVEREEGSVNPRVYPAPLLSHVDASTNSVTFFDALRQFHSAMGTRLMVPVIGGKELNLHHLYVQVTQRGGLEKVIMERMWREVIATFNFPPTTTSASFVLRKYYLNLLYHFEQVYFFRVQGPVIPPSAILQTKTPLSKLEPNYQQSSVCGSFMRSNSSLPLRPTGVARPIPANGDGNSVGASSFVPIAPILRENISTGAHNFNVSGTIDGKFEHGYFVTVKIDSQTLHGVLYHAHPLVSPYSSVHQANHAQSGAPVSSTAVVPYIPPTRSIRRRRRHRYRDPSHPKPNRSAYNFFFAEKHSKLKNQYPHQERQYSRMIGESWSKLTEEERKVYDAYGRRDKDRYRRELQEYKERMRPAPASATSRPREVDSEVVREKEIIKEVVTVTEVEMAEPSKVENEDE